MVRIHSGHPFYYERRMFEDDSRVIEDLIKNRLYEIKRDWLDQDVMIPVGKFEGRKGCVKFIGHDGKEIIVLIQPYRLERRGMVTVETKELLWEDSDARTYWRASRLGNLQKWDDIQDDY